MRRGVQFNGIHTGLNWGLILNEKIITPPVPKTHYVSVDGRSGDLDLTQSLTREVMYNNAQMKLKFTSVDSNYQYRLELVDEITRFLHGQKMTIIDDDDLAYYVAGRCTITNINRYASYTEIEIEINCEPFKMCLLENKITYTINNVEKSIILMNSGDISVMPEFKVDGEVTIKSELSETTINNNTYSSSKFKLVVGANNLILQGNGTVTISYREEKYCV